jgi:hypothetical protein
MKHALTSKKPGALVAGSMSFVCPCGRGVDHIRSLAVWTRPKGNAWAVDIGEDVFFEKTLPSRGLH